MRQEIVGCNDGRLHFDIFAAQEFGCQGDSPIHFMQTQERSLRRSTREMTDQLLALSTQDAPIVFAPRGIVPHNAGIHFVDFLGTGDRTDIDDRSTKAIHIANASFTWNQGRLGHGSVGAMLWLVMTMKLSVARNVWTNNFLIKALEGGVVHESVNHS